jgi:hypothetical protein
MGWKMSDKKPLSGISSGRIRVENKRGKPKGAKGVTGKL